MNKRYIDLNSDYRDRRLYPNPGEFGVRLAQSGNKDTIVTSKNPISLGYPYYQWQWGCTTVGTSGVGLNLGGPGVTDPPSNASITFPRGGGGTSHQPMPQDNPCTLGTLVAQTLSQQMTSTNNFFNGLLYQSTAPALGGATNADYNTSRIVAYKANPNILNTLRNQFSGIFTVESEMPAWDAGAQCRVENNLNAGTTTGTFIGSEVFIPAGVEASGVYVGDTYEAVMYATPGNPLCQQFRTITAYDGIRRVATLNAPLVGWVSPANDAGGVVPGCTYLHRLRRGVPLIPVNAPAIATQNMPLTQINNVANVFYSVELVNPGTGYNIGALSFIASPTGGQGNINILAITAVGAITASSISVQGVFTPPAGDAGFAVGQVLAINQGGNVTATLRITGVGFGVNVQGAAGITNASNVFTNQFFYVPALTQNNVAVGTATTDPSAAQQFIPQVNARVSTVSNVASPFFNQAYTKDTSACSIIRGDFFDAAGPTHFLVIEPFQNNFPINNFEFNILSYTDDHVIPMNYTGSTVSQGQMVCYQMTLESITLPNLDLEVLGLGGKIAFYPFIYVEFRNVAASSAGTVDQLIYSNNPSATKALFKCSITDTPTPTISRFIKIRGDGAQTVKFKPNDDLYVRVILPNGETFQTSLKDTTPPLIPNVLLQIALTVGIERI